MVYVLSMMSLGSDYIVIRCEAPTHARIVPELEVRGVALLLIVCSGSSLQCYLIAKGFFYYFLFVFLMCEPAHW